VASAHADPVDLSPEAIAAREAIYDIPGLALLTGPETPLQPGERIAFYGDSITWLGDYIDAVQIAIDASPETSGLGIVLINNGIDCAEATDILNGVQNFCGSQTEPPFVARLAVDNATIVVIYVGINEVRRGRGPVFAESEQALRDLVRLGKSSGARVVLAAPAVSGEYPDGSNPFDTDIDTYAAIGAQVASDARVTFVNLREVFIAYLGNHNVTVLPDETQVYQSSGVLTVDELHPNAAGISLLAEHMAFGIVRAYAEPVPTLGPFGGLVLGILIVAVSWRALRV
jgi:lysophospholipase L1-like esterase